MPDVARLGMGGLCDLRLSLGYSYGIIENHVFFGFYLFLKGIPRVSFGKQLCCRIGG